MQQQQYRLPSNIPPAHCHCPTEPKQLAAKLCDNYQVISVLNLAYPGHMKNYFSTLINLCVETNGERWPGSEPAIMN